MATQTFFGMFTPIWEDSHFDGHIFSNGLVQPPSRSASISRFPRFDEATLYDSTVSTVYMSFQYHTYHISIGFPIHSSVLENMDVIYDAVAVAIVAPLLNCTHHSCIEDQIFAVNGETIHKTLGWRTANHLMYRSVRHTPTTNIEPEKKLFF